MARVWGVVPLQNAKGYMHYNKAHKFFGKKCRDELVKKLWGQGRDVVFSRTTTICPTSTSHTCAHISL